MNRSTNPLLIYIATILAVNYAACAEFVPVYVWGTSKTSEHVPALHKISEDSFKDTILEYLKRRPFIVVFAEHTLSPEDFAQRDQAGEIAFQNIYDLKEWSAPTYRPYVQNPIGAIKQLDNRVTEVSIDSLLNNPEVGRDNILIVDLNDAKDDEHRFDMLKRHDSAIVAIYNEILEKHKNVLAIYTAHHTSWVAPQEITHRKSRALLADPEPEAPQSKIWKTDNSILYISNSGVIKTDTANLTINDWTASQENSETEVTLKLEKDASSLVFAFNVDEAGYWFLSNISLNLDAAANATLLQGPKVFAPRAFSYHCTNMVLNGSHNTVVTLPGFQVQPLFSNQSHFGDAYDCVGFTSIPIWSGLFVTAILLLIMTFGLTMMMDIRTMDRFDDAKGKTITINAAE